jgi:hypothetical protein
MQFEVEVSDGCKSLGELMSGEFSRRRREQMACLTDFSGSQGGSNTPL